MKQSDREGNDETGISRAGVPLRHFRLRLYAVSKWGIRHETLNLYDNARQRAVPVDLAVRWDYQMKAKDGFWKLPVAIISNGNTVRNTEYSFLANVFAARGYLVASIQQDLPTDPPSVTTVACRMSAGSRSTRREKPTSCSCSEH